ncbi:hypothetical protein F4778DRAFT_799605 [Xylariomycetidae sp. FL2044]|nr:hypothetical protein F4778DRAFT_799605 [Xylariomycetidae sp. FL2044]
MDAVNGVTSTSSNGGLTSTSTAADEAHDDFGPQVNICNWALAVLASAWVALRVYCKYMRHRGLWWDDYVLVASWFCLALGNSAISVAISMGFGKMSYDIDPAAFPRILLSLYIYGLWTNLAAALSKMSFGLTLLRISGGWMRAVVWFIMISVNLAFGTGIVINWAQCTPVEKNFNPFLPGQCWPPSLIIGYNIFTAAYSGIMDIVLAILPWKIIWNLDMNKKERFGAVCAMSMGIFAGMTALVKIYAIPGPTNADVDNSIQLVVLAAAEIAITIMAASIPILRALARDKGGPAAGGFFTRNATRRVTQHRRSPATTEFMDPGALAGSWPPPPPPLKHLGLGRMNKSAVRRPVLSQIREADETPQEVNQI